VVVDRLLQPAGRLEEIARPLDLVADARVVLVAAEHGGERVGREDQLVDRDLGGEARRRLRRWNVGAARLDARRVHPRGDACRRRGGDEHEAVNEANDEEGRQGEDRAEDAAERRELGDAQIARHQEHRRTRRQQQGSRNHGEGKAQQTVPGRAPQPVEPGEQRDPGLVVPAGRLGQGVASCSLGRDGVERDVRRGARAAGARLYRIPRVAAARKR
jgi:hypothetical protein